MSKITINQLHVALCEANSIMLTVHVRPDGDAIGSMVAFYEALVGQGKTVYMVVDDVVPEKYSFLRYTDHIHDVAYFETNPVDIDMLMVLDASTYERIGKVGRAMGGAHFFILESPRKSSGFVQENAHSSNKTSSADSTHCIHLAFNLFRRYKKRNPLGRLIAPKHNFYTQVGPDQRVRKRFHAIISRYCYFIQHHSFDHILAVFIIHHIQKIDR